MIQFIYFAIDTQSSISQQNHQLSSNIYRISHKYRIALQKLYKNKTYKNNKNIQMGNSPCFRPSPRISAIAPQHPMRPQHPMPPQYQKAPEKPMRHSMTHKHPMHNSSKQAPKKTNELFQHKIEDGQLVMLVIKKNRQNNDRQNKGQVINKKLIIQIAKNNQVIIDAQKHKQQKIMDVIKTYVNNNRVSCCLKVTNKNNQIISLNKKIQVIWKEMNAENELECILISSYDKFKLMTQLDSANFNYKNLNLTKDQIQIIENHIKQLRQLKRLQTYQEIELQNKKQQIIRPIAIYTSNYIYSEMGKIKRQFKLQEGQDFTKSSYFNLSSCLIKSLRSLRKCQGTAHRGIRGFLISQTCSINDIILFKSFTSTSSQLKICDQFTDQNCSILHIQHSTGRKIDYISMRKEQQQVLFLPYTYYYVKNIITQRNQNIKKDEIWLIQIPSPEYFTKSIIFYLNKYSPQNSQLLLNLQCEENIQILYLRQQKYLQFFDFLLSEFIQILKLRQIRFKVIIEEEIPEKVDEAIKILFGKYQAFVDVLVICNGYKVDTEKYKGIAEDISIKQFIKVSQSFKKSELKKFCRFNQNI